MLWSVKQFYSNKDRFNPKWLHYFSFGMFRCVHICTISHSADWQISSQCDRHIVSPFLNLDDINNPVIHCVSQKTMKIIPYTSYPKPQINYSRYDMYDILPPIYVQSWKTALNCFVYISLDCRLMRYCSVVRTVHVFSCWMAKQTANILRIGAKRPETWHHYITFNWYMATVVIKSPFSLLWKSITQINITLYLAKQTVIDKWI